MDPRGDGALDQLTSLSSSVVDLAASAAPPEPDPRARDAEAAREFEAYLLKMLLAEMRKGVSSGGLFSDEGLEGYQALMDDALSRRAAEAGSFGLAQQLLRDWEQEG